MAVRAVTMRNTSVQHCSPVPPFLTIATISELSWLATRQEFRLSGGLSTTRAQFSLCAGVDSALSSVDHFADDRLPELPVRPNEAALGVKRPDRAPNRRLHCLSVDKHHEISFAGINYSKNFRLPLQPTCRPNTRISFDRAGGTLVNLRQVSGR